MKPALYTRVPTLDQNPELQLDDLQAYAQRQGWEIVDTYQDVFSLLGQDLIVLTAARPVRCCAALPRP